MPRKPAELPPHRNDHIFDAWSLVHIAVGALFGWYFAPWVAFTIMAIWEPLEIFILSPWLARRGIVFGYESWRNSVSDIIFNAIGIAAGVLLTK